MLASIFKVFIARKEFFLELLLEHIQISIISITLAMIIGLVIGFVISEFKKSTKVVIGIVNSVYTIPSISLLGFLIPITGIGNKTAIIALTIYALLPMVRNTHAGLTNINPLLVEAAIGMGSTKMQVLIKITSCYANYYRRCKKHGSNDHCTCRNCFFYWCRWFRCCNI